MGNWHEGTMDGRCIQDQGVRWQVHFAGHLPVPVDKASIRRLDDETPGSLVLLDDSALLLQIRNPHVDARGQVFRSNDTVSFVVVQSHLLPVFFLLSLQDAAVWGLGQ